MQLHLPSLCDRKMLEMNQRLRNDPNDGVGLTDWSKLLPASTSDSPNRSASMEEGRTKPVESLLRYKARGYEALVSATLQKVQQLLVATPVVASLQGDCPRQAS